MTRPLKTTSIILLSAARVVLLLLGGILMIWGALCLLSVSHTEISSLQGILWGLGFIAISFLTIWSALKLGRRAAAMTDSADDVRPVQEDTLDHLE